MMLGRSEGDLLEAGTSSVVKARRQRRTVSPKLELKTRGHVQNSSLQKKRKMLLTLFWGKTRGIMKELRKRFGDGRERGEEVREGRRSGTRREGGGHLLSSLLVLYSVSVEI